LSKLVLDLRVPNQYDKQVITDIIRAVCTQVNNLSEGKLSARYQAQTTHPSTNASVAYAKGDIVWNSDPTEIGSVAAGIAAKYVLAGWIVVNPGIGPNATWKDIRWLTGN
jgi:hypothetical protein